MQKSQESQGGDDHKRKAKEGSRSKSVAFKSFLKYNGNEKSNYTRVSRNPNLVKRHKERC